MDRTERFYKIEQLLRTRQVVPRTILLEELEVSLATLKRDLAYMRDRLNAPIIWDRGKQGYTLAKDQIGKLHYQLPGIWFNASEIYALLTMHHLLSTLQPGILSPHIEPLLIRLRAMLGEQNNPSDEIQHRVKILGMATRKVAYQYFEMIGSALLQRKRLNIVHLSRSKNEINEREISPQRLIHYRDNWYLDAWCHFRNGLRTFAVDGITKTELIEKKAKNIPDKKLDDELGSSYGIISSSKKLMWAKLKFSPRRSRWVAQESWHKKQKSYFDTDGSYFLEVPYGDHEELLMDIMKYGADVEVISPASLRQIVKTELAKATTLYIIK